VTALRYIYWPLCGTYSDRRAVHIVTAVRYKLLPLFIIYIARTAVHILTALRYIYWPLCGTYCGRPLVHIVTAMRYIHTTLPMELLLNNAGVFPHQHKNIHYTEWPTKKYPNLRVNVINIFISIKITTNVTLLFLSYFTLLETVTVWTSQLPFRLTL
jgi:hypothetical protein